MNNKNLIIGGVILAGIVAYYFYNKNKGVVSSNEPVSKIQKNACGQAIPTNIPCFKDLDNDGKCYDSKGMAIDVSKMPQGKSCFNKNGTSRDARNIAV